MKVGACAAVRETAVGVAGAVGAAAEAAPVARRATSIEGIA
jgi:hypothetical protein